MPRRSVFSFPTSIAILRRNLGKRFVRVRLLLAICLLETLLLAFGTVVAFMSRMTTATYKPIEVSTPRATLTPCIFDDDPIERDSLSTLIMGMGYEPISTSDPEEALRLIRVGRCRLVFASVHLDTHDPYQFLGRALRCDPGIHLILMTAEYTLEAALEAIRRGACDFLPRPIDQIRLKRTLDDVASLYDQRRRVRALEEQLLKDLEFHGIVHGSHRHPPGPVSNTPITEPCSWMRSARLPWQCKPSFFASFKTARFSESALPKSSE
jgi:CheY-like chemotaxis protein